MALVCRVIDNSLARGTCRGPLMFKSGCENKLSHSTAVENKVENEHYDLNAIISPRASNVRALPDREMVESKLAGQSPRV